MKGKKSKKTKGVGAHLMLMPKLELLFKYNFSTVPLSTTTCGTKMPHVGTVVPFYAISTVHVVAPHGH